MKSWQEYFSINEQRLSMLVMELLLFTGFALWQYVSIGKIDPSIQTIILSLIGAIAGFNIVDIVKKNVL